MRLVGVLIEDDFEIINSKLNYPLWLNHSIVKKSINFTGSTCRTVLLNGTRIGEDPLVSGKDECLLLGSSHINGNVFLRDGFWQPAVFGCHIPQSMGSSVVWGRFWAPGGVALHADGVRVNSGVF